MQRYYNTDLLDLWRFDDHGRRLLTPRRIGVLLRHLPPGASTVLATGGNGWTLTDHLLADVYHATAGEAHPGKPISAKGSPERDKAISEAKARARERQRAIDAGEIT